MIVAQPLNNLEIATAICDAADVVGNLVHFSGPKIGFNYQVLTADPTDLSKIPCVAYIIAKISPTKAVIQFSGEVTPPGGSLITTARYVASASGTLVEVSGHLPPGTGEVFFSQNVGIALSTTVFRLSLSNAVATIQRG